MTEVSANIKFSYNTRVIEAVYEVVLKTRT